MRTIVVVLCYGVFDANWRTPAEMAGYRLYLRDVAETIRGEIINKSEVTVLISGGVTANNKIEATTVKRQIALNLCEMASEVEEWILEDRSLTTPANIWESFRIINEKLAEIDSHYRILITCDIPRKYKVQWLIKKWYARAKKLDRQGCHWSSSNLRCLLSWPEAEVIALYRPDISPKSTCSFQWLETQILKVSPPILNDRIGMLRPIETT